ncbi:MAG TPA: SRPBCC domain-containing protein [Acidobacteriaceae bacterium]
MTDSTASTHTLVIEREFPHAPEKIWRALTESALIQQWLMQNDFQPTVGHKFNLRTTPMPNWNGVIDCEVVAIKPLQVLSYTWGSLGLKSVVTFTLTATTAGTHLRMEQSGFPDTESAYYKGASYGWQKFLGSLEKVVEELQ